MLQKTMQICDSWCAIQINHEREMITREREGDKVNPNHTEGVSVNDFK